MADVRITTTDNPYDPFDDFDHWYLYDQDKGYNTVSYLGRIVHESDSFSPKEEEDENERAIDEIIKYDFMGIYKKVTRNNAKIKTPA